MDMRLSFDRFPPAFNAGFYRSPKAQAARGRSGDNA
jgi:hypothetical protein